MNGVLAGQAMRPPVIAIAALGPGDGPRLAELHAQVFERAWTAPEFDRMLTGSVAVGLAARAPGETALCGFILVRAVAGEAEILTFGVRADRRRLGYGGALVAAAAERSVRRGCARMFLEVDENNGPALALYRAYGFETVGRRAGYYRLAGGGGADALVLARTLVPQVDDAGLRS